MKIKLLLLILAVALCGRSMAQVDSIDVLHYDLTLDVDHNEFKVIDGRADITVQMLLPCNQYTFDLMEATIDSVHLNGISNTFSYTDNVIAIPISNAIAMQIDTISIYYHSRGFVEGHGWGGFHMNSNIEYNLGVSFDLQPHNFGRAWFPCRDNFYDKATYGLTLTTKNGWRSACSGLKISETINEDGSNTSRWELNHPTPTYLYSAAMGPFHFIERDFEGLYGTYPGLLAFVGSDSIRTEQAFDIMDDVIPYFEKLYGPYRWDKVGYVATPKGSMEHISNIALVDLCMDKRTEQCQGVRVHEFSHSWFGNLITCATSEDMWFNEGGATFSEEVAFEGAYDKEYSNNYYNTRLEKVLRANHHDEGGFLALHGIQFPNVYGSTTYDKGAVTWHTLRGYLGDSLFYKSIKRLFDNHAFGTVTAAQVCDSLSLYTGQDLSKFFDFYIYNPGFVDFVIDSMWTKNSQTHITIHQQLLGAPQYADANRVPVTFFSYDRQQSSKQIITFDGASTTATFTLPFTPAYAILDYDKELSDAVTDEEETISASHNSTFKNAHIKIANKSSNDCYVHVAHHWTAPQSKSQEGIIRTANRFWEIHTSANANPDISISFRYSRGDVNSVVKYLDCGFYDDVATMDSIGVLYRPDASSPWQLMTRKHDSNANVGYFNLSGLQSGQYTLAVVDTSILSIEQPSMQLNFIYPNPSHGNFKVNAPENNCTLNITSLAGQTIAKIENVGDIVSLSNIQPATYIAQLINRNGKIIATQKIIIQ